MVDPAVDARFRRGLDDRLVSCATAEISREAVVDRLPRGFVGILVQREKRHDESGRAITALASVCLHHRLLYGMKLIQLPPKIFNRDQLLAVQHGKKNEAGIHRPVTNPVAGAEFAQDERARPAVPFSAPFLHAFVAVEAAEIIQDGRGWIRMSGRPKINRLKLAIEDKRNRGLHRASQSRFRRSFSCFRPSWRIAPSSSVAYSPLL